MPQDINVYEALLERAGEANPRPRIEPVARLMKYLGDPQLEFDVIHVGGTNGKTSTARAIEIILRSHGIKTGLFTSPHLVDFTERIRIDGEQITHERLADAWLEMQPALNLLDTELISEGQSRITFFEALVALMLVAFSDAPVEVAVVEVGMGGEWDATNVVNSAVSVFAPIDVDHTDFLGSSVAEIAGTKAKIISRDSEVVTARQNANALEVIRAETVAQNSRVHVADESFKLLKDIAAVGGRMFSVQGLSGHIYENLLLPLFGEHQTENTLLAIAAVEAYFGTDRHIDEEVLEIAFSNLTSPGRIDIVGKDPLIIVDSAHNPHGARTLANSVKEHFDYSELGLVVGVFEDKDGANILQELVPLAAAVNVTQINSERSADPHTLGEIARQIASGVPVEEFDEVAHALSEARAWASEAEGRIVLVAGSVHLAGEAIELANQEGYLGN